MSAVVIRRAVVGTLRRLGGALEPGFCRTVPLGCEFRAPTLAGNLLPEPLATGLAQDMEAIHAALERTCPGSGRAELYATADDECRKFHTDHYRLRVLVTYVGPGTEIAPESALDRGALGTGGDDVELANRAIVGDRRRIVRARPFDIVLLKGERFDAGLAAVHRSPPISSEGLSRFVLKLTVD